MTTVHHAARQGCATAALPAAEKASVAAQLQHLIDQHPALRGRASIEFPYQTQAYACQRVD